MKAVSGVFKTQSDAARAVEEIRKTGTPADRVTLLTPGSEVQIDQEVQSVPVDSTGGALLVALIPGIGPISALGLLGAGILGAAGATLGATAGGKAENAVT